MKPLSQGLKTVTSLFRTQPKQIGLPPGSLIHVGVKEMERPIISRVDFNATSYRHSTDIPLGDCHLPTIEAGISWIHLDGLHDVSLVSELGGIINLHPLALEDILNTNHPPKLEEYPEATLIILKLLANEPETGGIEAEQLSLVLAPGRLFSFHEQPGDLFKEVYRRLENKNGKFRERGADYLAYSLIDSVVDSYYHVLETIGEQLDQIEAELLSRPSREHLQQIHQLRGQLFFVRKVVAPLRDLIGSLIHSESVLIDTRTRIYLRDLHEHVFHVMDNVENYRDTAKGLIELSLSSMSHSTNEVMQVLTVIASIFIPLTFIAGVYGMNFTVMPELHWRFGYPLILGLMGACAVGMLWFFKRKKWF